MKIKLVFATATAIGLMMSSGVVLADSNVSVVVQTNGNSNNTSVDQDGGDFNKAKVTQRNGSGNDVDITQSGNTNYAGVSLELNVNGTDPTDTAGAIHTYGYMTQDGSDNSLTIKQTVGHNIIGYYSGSAHLAQIGNHNQANITQNGGVSGGALLDTVIQTALSATGLANKLTVLQQGGAADYPSYPVGQQYHYSNENIGTVAQTYTGGAHNELTLTQKGGSYVNPPNNEINHVVQNGGGNTGEITETGRTNMVSLLSQIGTSNDASIDLTGTGNGSMVPNVYANLHGANPFSAGAASAAGVGQATASQQGDRNFLSYSANGMNNKFGFVQSGVVSGDDNDITGTTVDNDNQVAVGQWGNNNNTTFSQSGDANDLGVAIHGDNNGRGGFGGAAVDVGLIDGDVRQSGGGNFASITIGDITNASSNNDYAAKQTGGGNTLTLSLKYGSSGNGNNSVAVSQAGDDTATITVTGSSNVLGVRQLGSGTNSLTATIDGSSNNSSTTMTGDAGDLGLKAGSIFQNNTGGLNNDVTLTIQTSLNKFAVKQVGSDNHVTGSVTTGNGNQAAVIQVGMSNTASFLQNGGGNNIGITQ